MSAADGWVVGTTKIVDHGPDARRWVLAIVAEGFTQPELGLFEGHAKRFVKQLFLIHPFNGAVIQAAINVYRIDVVSTDSGADDPKACGGGDGMAARTFFDAKYCGDGRLRRLLTVDNRAVLRVLKAQVPLWDHALVIVNSNRIAAGSGAHQIAVTSTGTRWKTMAVHELGHAAFDLADEYAYYQGCASGENGHDRYTGAEPRQCNVTTHIDPATLKWRALLTPGVPLPTTTNPDCGRCDPPPANPLALDGVVGAFEGAHNHHCGVFRPTLNCLMRDLSHLRFCAVCAARVRDIVIRTTP